MKQENNIYYTVRKEKNVFLLCYSFFGSKYIDFYNLSEHYHDAMSYCYYLSKTKPIKNINDLPINIKNKLIEYCKPNKDCPSNWIFRNKLKHNDRFIA